MSWLNALSKEEVESTFPKHSDLQDLNQLLAQTGTLCKISNLLAKWQNFYSALWFYTGSQTLQVHVFTSRRQRHKVQNYNCDLSGSRVLGKKTLKLHTFRPSGTDRPIFPSTQPPKPTCLWETTAGNGSWNWRSPGTEWTSPRRRSSPRRASGRWVTWKGCYRSETICRPCEHLCVRIQICLRMFASAC